MKVKRRSGRVARLCERNLTHFASNRVGSVPYGRKFETFFRICADVSLRPREDLT